MRGPKPEPLDLCRSEVAHVADALEVLVKAYGSRLEARRETGVGKNLFNECLQRRAAEKVTWASLEKLAAIFGVSVEELLAGKGSRVPLVAA